MGTYEPRLTSQHQLLQRFGSHQCGCRSRWQSAHPNKEELLWFNFALNDIAEAADHTKRPTELRLLNLFEQTLQNERASWTVDEKALKKCA